MAIGRGRMLKVLALGIVSSVVLLKLSHPGPVHMLVKAADLVWTVACWHAGVGRVSEPDLRILRVIDSWVEPTDTATTLMEDYKINDVPCRLYTPRNNNSAKLPLFVWIHGGGFVIGSGRSKLTNSICTRFSEMGMKVLSVDYSLAPEYPFPKAVNECDSVVSWLLNTVNDAKQQSGPTIADPLSQRILEDVDLNRIMVGGESAGGNLATVSVVQARDRGQSQLIYKQVLVYPGILFDKNEAEGLLIPVKLRDYFMQCYLPDYETQVNDPRTNPMKSPAGLSDLPPTLILTAEFDPLQKDGLVYANGLKEAGVSVTHHHHATAAHGFLGFPISEAEEAYSQISAFVFN